ncbi:unnamed protein product [Acanthoscelides obtectus]|uniref:Uncharacterized protein n=1 Tax=Acanthoscelides obtectus TaxID=200917 RepID=A0A9P0L316_ACAOB|nr:unnamed protein product [Acanthoscelides obtectus]CAK1660410.1 hypothetical protein AOBTE_LOCUS22045 [Acanthoscelides obtectus]
MGKKIPQGATLNVVFENRESLIACIEEIEENFTNETLQKRKTEPAQVKTAIDNFEKCFVDVRNKIDDRIKEAKIICTEPQGNKRRRRNNSSHDHPVAALEVCDNIVNSANRRFQFKDHLVAASLFFSRTLWRILW